eukprot:6546714-Prymnesium_polylepis.1
MPARPKGSTGIAPTVPPTNLLRPRSHHPFTPPQALNHPRDVPCSSRSSPPARCRARRTGR